MPGAYWQIITSLEQHAGFFPMKSRDHVGLLKALWISSTDDGGMTNRSKPDGQ